MEDFKIFLVGDDLFSLNQYQQGLNDLGYHDIKLFDNGGACLHNLHRKPSVVFLNHNLHEPAGFEVLRRIKRHDPNIYVVITLAQEDTESAVDALRYGAFDCVLKNGGEIPRMKELLARIIAIQEEIKTS